MHILIIEDEQAAARRLEKLLLEQAPEAIIDARLESVEAGIVWLQQHPAPDLILMDIHLADGSCFEIFEHVKVNSPVIFTTAFDDYALQAFKVNAIDYLLKPIKSVELNAALEKYRRMHPKQPDWGTLLEHMRNQEPQNYLRRMLVRLGNSIKLIDMSEVSFFYTKDKITFLVTNQTAKRYPVDYPLDKLESLLDPADFFRINRQFILRINAIREMQPYSKSRIKVETYPPSDQEIVVSTERAAAFKKWLVGDLP
ncbi:MAG: LytTR family DNA-binding domain-containing protein [Bacteroidetes bacterium]|nr:LytTR family DNA-binding domain-containing protein [Bacteroidota bacterium]